MPQETDLKMVQDVAEKLGEHFDSVHIFATRHEPGELEGTVNINWGLGNWFTRYGQVREWLVVSDEQARARVTRTVQY